MKMTKAKAKTVLKAIKSGLSIVLTVVLMGNYTEPLQVLAASPDESVVITPEVVETETDVLLKVCKDQGFDETCAKHLMGILMQESVGKATAVGDHGMSRGWFQIHRYYNPEVTVQCAEDLECSATWTLNHLIKKGYPKTVKWAIWCHNGCGISKSYVYNVLRKGETAWTAPLTIVTADASRAARLALK
jgi:hypothetical protein